MAYEDLLPTVEELADALTKKGVPAETVALVFEKVGNLLSEHSDYYSNEYERIGDKESIGKREVLREFATDFESSGRYATAHYGDSA